MTDMNSKTTGGCKKAGDCKTMPVCARYGCQRTGAVGKDWEGLYRRAINEANGLTNYVEDRPELRSAEKRIAAIEAEARE